MPKTLGRGGYWKDPAKAAQATQSMKDSWAARRYFLVTWESGREVRTSDIEEVAKLVGRSAQTLRVYLAQKHGVTSFAHDDEMITVRRVYRQA